MSRATHDIECSKSRGGCGFQGKVPDDVIICPRCGRSVEGQPASIEEVERMIENIKRLAVQKERGI